MQTHEQNAVRSAGLRTGSSAPHCPPALRVARAAQPLQCPRMHQLPNASGSTCIGRARHRNLRGTGLGRFCPPKRWPSIRALQSSLLVASSPPARPVTQLSPLVAARLHRLVGGCPAASGLSPGQGWPRNRR